MEIVSFELNGKSIDALPGETILQAADSGSRKEQVRAPPQFQPRMSGNFHQTDILFCSKDAGYHLFQPYPQPEESFHLAMHQLTDHSIQMKYFPFFTPLEGNI